MSVRHFKYVLAVFAVNFLSASASASAKIVADCGQMSGKAFYADPRFNKWQDDAISDGRILVDAIAGDKATVIIKNALGTTSDVRDLGGRPIVVAHTPDWSEFTIMVAYPSGTVETYSATEKGGYRALMLAASRHSAGPVPPKVSAYVAKCEPR